jgi:GT2 family glycosyltransferase
MKIKFAIGIPTLNRADLLIPTLELYLKDFPSTQIFILDNGNQNELYSWYTKNNPTSIRLIVKDENLGVAKSWNLLLKEIYREHEYAMILNDDIYLGSSESNIQYLIDRYPTQKLLTNPLDWCVFIMPKSTYQMNGEFDEQFYPAYCEDNDYVYRLKLKGHLVFKTPALLPQLHRESMTLEMDYTIATAYHENKERYMEKWGGAPDFEVFKKPYNKN